jgi:hypothetical protein
MAKAMRVPILVISTTVESEEKKSGIATTAPVRRVAT